MVTTNLNLSMNNPEVVQIHAKQGDSGRLYKVNLKDATEENGTLRILRPDGVEVTADAIKSAGGDAYKGDLVTFDALEEVPLTKCEVALESSQDLHGYANPWPSGGGKNKLEPLSIASVKLLNTAGTWSGNVYSSNGLTYTPVLDADDCMIGVTINGTASANTNFYVKRMDASPFAGMTLSGCPSGSAGELDYSLQSAPYTGWAYDLGSGATISASAAGMSILFILVKSGKTINNQTFMPMIRSSGDSSYAPYSNICPIVASNGKNLLPLLDGTYSLGVTGASAVVENGKVTISGTTTASGGRTTRLSNFFTLKAGTYTISPQLSASPYIRVYVNKKSDDSSVGYNMTFTLTEDTEVYVGIGLESGYTYDNVIYPQIVVGSAVSPYVPYQGIGVNIQGLNCLNLDRTVSSPYPSTTSNTTSPRIMGISHYYLGLRHDNYYNASVITSYSVSADEVFVKASNNAYGIGFPIEVEPNTKYTFSGRASANSYLAFSYYDANWNYLSNVGTFQETYTFETPNNCKYAVIVLRSTSTTDGTTWTKVQVQKGEQATSYEPYQGNTYSLSLGQKVYGGYVDLVSGKLTITHFYHTVDGDDVNGLSSDATNFWRVQMKSGSYIPHLTGNTYKMGLCNRYKFVTSYNEWLATKNAIALSRQDGASILISDATFSDTASCVASFNATPLEFVYPLDTPIEIQL